MSILQRFDIARVRWPAQATLLAAAAVACSTVPVAAQRTAPPTAKSDTGDIVVLGQSKKERSKAAHAFVRGLTVVRPGEPIARFEPNTYCPVVFGLGSVLNQLASEDKC